MMPTVCVKVCLLQSYFLNEDRQPREEADSVKQLIERFTSSNYWFVCFLKIPCTPNILAHSCKYM